MVLFSPLYSPCSVLFLVETTGTVTVLKSERPVSNTHKHWNHFGLFVKMRYMQYRFSGFL